MPVLSKVKNGLFLDEKIENDLTVDAVKKYSIKTADDRQAGFGAVGRKPAEDHIRALDIGQDGSAEAIDTGRADEGHRTLVRRRKSYQMVCDFAKQGIGVIFISSELTEVLNVSDNIIVMHNGRITGQVSRQEATEERVLELRYA